MRAAAERSGRDPDAVALLAVTKYAKLEDVRSLLESGAVTEIGESRVQDARAKKEALGPLAGKVRWRLIGHLQTNKAKLAAELFDAVDSVDSLKVGAALDKALAPSGKRLPVLVQVKLAEKDTQSGVRAEAVGALLEGLKAFPHIDPRGLMAIAPELEPVEEVRPHFRRVRELFERFFASRKDAQLSMGMSRDFEVAVEEGATMVRIGSKVFS